MRRIPRIALIVTPCLALIATAQRAQAQPSPTESAGFLGIVLTPVGALPQLVQVHGADDTTSRLSANMRYSGYEFVGRRFHNVGIGARYRVMKRVAAGATLGTRTCAGCEGLRMASLDLDVTLVHRAATEPGSGDTDLGLQLSGGIGRPNEARFNARSLSASLPIAITLPQPDDAWLTLHISPALAYGYINDGSGSVLGYAGGDGTTRFIVGAGVGYALSMGLGAHAVVHRIIIEDSPTQLGFAVSYAFGRARR